MQKNLFPSTLSEHTKSMISISLGKAQLRHRQGNRPANTVPPDFGGECFCFPGWEAFCHNILIFCTCDKKDIILICGLKLNISTVLSCTRIAVLLHWEMTPIKMCSRNPRTFTESLQQPRRSAFWSWKTGLISGSYVLKPNNTILSSFALIDQINRWWLMLCTWDKTRFQSPTSLTSNLNGFHLRKSHC